MNASQPAQQVQSTGGGETADRLVQALSRVVRGKKTFLKKFAACLIAGGHVLIEDAPGLGKTTVAKTLARLIATGPTSPGPASPGPPSERVAADGTVPGEPVGVPFRRIQFTPDLLPYDITGVDVYDPDSRSFIFQPGPVFACVVLADEINRSTPKVQSALLEVMAEHQVTVGTKTHTMDELFFVMATQNPLEIEGTYPLPLAQLDRFLMRIALGYPDEQSEFDILKEDPSTREMPNIQPLCSKADILSAREEAAAVYCDDRLIRAVARIAGRSRSDESMAWGISPRGGLMLLSAARAWALCSGRNYIIDEDILELCADVLAHRLRSHDPRADVRAAVEAWTRAELEKVPHGNR